MSKSEPSVTKKLPENSWLIPFMDLREKLRPFQTSGVALYHEAVVCNLDKDKDLWDIVMELDADCEGSRVKTEIPVFSVRDKAGNKTWVRHYFFAEDCGIYEKFKNLGPSESLPQSVAGKDRPRFAPLPSMPRRAATTMIRWMGLLYHLAWKYREEELWVNTFCSDSVTDWDFE